MQAMCFLAGANSIFYGEQLLTTGNPQFQADQQLFKRMGIQSSKAKHTPVFDARTEQLLSGPVAVLETL